MPSAWFRRNVFHPCEGGPLLRANYLATLIRPMSMPSLRSSIDLGAPHNGWRCSSRGSADEFPTVQPVGRRRAAICNANTV